MTILNRVYQKEPGDCFRACLASMLGMNLVDVPPFFKEIPNGQPIPAHVFEGMQQWLLTRGYCFVEFGFKGALVDVLANIEAENPNMVWILTACTRQGDVHSAIFRGGCALHDPACNPGHTVLTGPGPDGTSRVAVLALTPRNLTI